MAATQQYADDEVRDDGSEGLEELLDYERRRQSELAAAPPAHADSSPASSADSSATSSSSAPGAAPEEWEKQMVERAQRADHLYRLGYQRAQEADKRAQEAKRKFEEEKEHFRAQVEERRREAERLHQIATQKRLEAQEARRQAQEQKELGKLEARRATLILLDRVPEDEHSARSSGNYDTLTPGPTPLESRSRHVSVSAPHASLRGSHQPHPPPNPTANLPPIALSSGMLTTASNPSSEVGERHAARLQTVNRDSIDELADSLVELKMREDPLDSHVEGVDMGDEEVEESEIKATIVSVRLAEGEDTTHETPVDSPVSPRTHASPRRHDMPKAKKLPVDIDEAQRKGLVIITRDKTLKYTPRVNQRLGSPWASAPDLAPDDALSSPLSASPDAASDLLLAPIIPSAPEAEASQADTDEAVQRVVAKTTLDAVLSGKARSSSDLGDLLRVNVANKPREPVPVNTASPRSQASTPTYPAFFTAPPARSAPLTVVKKKSLEDIGNKKAQKSPSLSSVPKKDVEDREESYLGRKKRLKSLKSPLTSFFSKDKDRERESHTTHTKDKEREKKNSNE